TFFEANREAKIVSEQLSERQSQILEYIKKVARERVYPPSVREIGQAVGLSSSSTVHSYLTQLERGGWIRKDPTKSRAIQVVEDMQHHDLRQNAVPIPLVGSVAAGVPILAEQNIEDHLLLSSTMAKEGWFALKVRGDSMINAGILDGDVVVVDPRQDASDGTIIVALVDDEATVKRLDRSTGRVRLIAENPAYSPLEPEQVSMLGEVKGVVRTYH
ncbi:MAG: transcriptional repressor LexA, partial [Candidatus Dormibacteraceae bacterium]